MRFYFHVISLDIRPWHGTSQALMLAIAMYLPSATAMANETEVSLSWPCTKETSKLIIVPTELFQPQSQINDQEGIVEPLSAEELADELGEKTVEAILNHLIHCVNELPATMDSESLVINIAKIIRPWIDTHSTTRRLKIKWRSLLKVTSQDFSNSLVEVLNDRVSCELARFARPDTIRDGEETEIMYYTRYREAYGTTRYHSEHDQFKEPRAEKSSSNNRLGLAYSPFKKAIPLGRITQKITAAHKH